jgi:hypothetical protein
MSRQLRFPLVVQLFILTRFAHLSSCAGVKGCHQELGVCALAPGLRKGHYYMHDFVTALCM